MKNFYGRLMLDIEGETLSNEEKKLISNPNVCGVILFARNYANKAQVRDLILQIKSTSPDILIGVDQEGGRVQRFRNEFVRLPSMQALGDLMSASPASAISFIRDVGWLMATEIKLCSVDFSFAPVLDVDRDTSSVIGDRSFSDDPELVSIAAKAFIEGIHEAGLPCVGKHFPGHGSVKADSHIDHPLDSRTINEIQSHDLIPFAHLTSHLDAIMPAHMTFPNIDKDPVTYSEFWLKRVLRENLRFRGVIFSDDLSMKGAEIDGNFSDRAKLALKSGCDVVLICNNREGALQALHHLEKNDYQSNTVLDAMWQRSRNDTIELDKNAEIRLEKVKTAIEQM